LASLRHPNIISVLDYGFDEQPYFTLELLENAKPFLTVAQNQVLAGQVDLTLQLLQALAYLHRRGILHLDLKPSNVMVVEGQVKVLDFGLALTRQPLVTLDGMGSDSGAAEGVVGTLYYVAPEMILNVPASIASDLYAVGVMLYQLCAGQLPFTTKDDPRALMVKIATEYPDYDRFPDHPLRMVIERLLLKDPDDRYASAEETIRAVCIATGTPPPPETSAVRESFLQAASFVGRGYGGGGGGDGGATIAT